MASRPSGWRVRIVPVLLGLSVLPVAACGEDRGPAPGETSKPVEGLVTVGGKPAEGVEVRLHPLNRYFDADAPHPSATTDEQGRFRLRSSEGQQGTPTGQYVATLVWPSARGGADRLGGAFAEPGGSGLTAVIDRETTEIPPFKVVFPGRKGASR